MNKLLAIGAVLAVLSGGSATAADLSVGLPVYAPPRTVVAPLYSWTGCFIGGNVGGGWAQKSFKDALTLASLGNHIASGVMGGGQFGCDYQMGWAVFGGQGMFDGVSATSNNLTPGGAAVMTTSVRRFSTVTARVGVAPTPSFLVYVRGGAAWVADDHTVQTPAGTVAFTANATRSGWTAGIGLEWGFLPNWSFFGEYDYANFAARTLDFTPVFGGDLFRINVQQEVHLLLVGVNFRFTSLFARF